MPTPPTTIRTPHGRVQLTRSERDALALLLDGHAVRPLDEPHGDDDPTPRATRHTLLALVSLGAARHEHGAVVLARPAAQFGAES